MIEAEMLPWMDALDIPPPEYFHPGAEWVNVECVLAPWRHESGTDSNPSMGLLVCPGESKVYCFSCQYSGTQDDLVLELRHLCGGERPNTQWAFALELTEHARISAPLLPSSDLAMQPPVKEIIVWPEMCLEPYMRTADIPGGHPYLTQNRQMPLTVQAGLDMRWDPHDARVCFPIRNFEGDLVGLHGRAVYPNPKIPYLMYPPTNAVCWYGEAWVDDESPVVVAESVFDLARVAQVYRNVISPLSAGMGVHKIARIDFLGELVLLFDSDKAGQRAREKLKECLPQTIIRDAYVPHGKDPSDLSAYEVAALLEPFVTLDDVVL